MATKAKRTADAGFTLIEVLAVLLLTGLILSGLTMLTGQWMRSWDRGARYLQDADLIAVALDRIRSDVGSASPILAGGREPSPAFTGTEREIRFIQESRDPHAPPRFEVVGYAPLDDGFGLQRSRAALPPAARLDSIELQAATPVLKRPYHAKFSFVDAEGRAHKDWRRLTPPSGVRLEVSTEGAGAWSGLITAMPVHAQAPLVCLEEKSFAHCVDIIEGRAKSATADGAPDALRTQSGASGGDALR